MASNEPRWHPAAIEDAAGVRDWYARRSPLAARGFLLELEAALVAVLEAPSRWPRGGASTRRYVFPKRYPFTLVYRLEPDCSVRIVVVAHQSRRPDYWFGR